MKPARPGRTARLRCRNPCGFAPVEILPGDVGYVNVSFFFRLEEARASIAEAMRKVREAKALIVDLRENGGGSPDTVVLLASYLLEQPGMPLFEVIERSGATERYTTGAEVLRQRWQPTCVRLNVGADVFGWRGLFVSDARARAGNCHRRGDGRSGECGRQVPRQ
jgi:hypothetical protein